jgi:hypothetical protein
MLQEGGNGSQKRFHIDGSKICLRRSASEECSLFDGRRVSKVTIDDDQQDR